MIEKYESCLENNGILRKHGLCFQDHILTKRQPGTAHIQSKIADINPDKLAESAEDHVEMMKENPEFMNPEKIHKDCVAYKELNPKTNRCVKKCPPNKIRDENFHCISTKKRGRPKKTLKIRVATPPSMPPLKPLGKICPPSKELNPLTKRCVNRCPEGQFRNAKFQCRKTKKFRIRVKKHHQ